MTTMPRRALLLLTSLLVLTAVLAPPAAAQTGTLDATGRVVWDDGSGPVGTPCCDVHLTLTSSDMATSTADVRTDENGNFTGTLDCVGTPPYEVFLAVDCCMYTDVRTVDACEDVDFGEIGCDFPPITGHMLFEGGVVCRNGLFLDPVADCGILVRNEAGRPVAFTHTGASGDWSVCVPCDDGIVPTWTVESQCCPQTRTIEDFTCPTRQPVETFVCEDCPVPPCPDARDVELTGQVFCGDASTGEVFPDCNVTVTVFNGMGTPTTYPAVTDSTGTWTACVECPATATDPTWNVLVESECCTGTSQTVLEGCAPTAEVLPVECMAVPCGGTGDCDPASEYTVTGRVTCPDPLFPGGRRPIPDAAVLVEGEGCLDSDGDTTCDESCPTLRTTTDSEGFYTVCLPCDTCTSVVVTAVDCMASNAGDLGPACGDATTLDLDCATCPDDPVPCGTDFQEVSGVVTCVRPGTTDTEPVPGCEVVVECAGLPAPLSTTTAPDGSYSICLPCFTCDVATVTATCCGESQVLDVAGCSDRTADFECEDCDHVFGPCPGEPQVRASGVVRCASAGTATPLAGCEVELTGLDPTGAPVSSALTTTSGDGTYETCLPCGPDGLSAVEAHATCCDATTTTPVDDCPVLAELEPIECPDCSPCPAGRTRLQGRIRCRGGGPVADCVARITLTTETGEETYLATTDSEGKYRLCVPCPVPGTVVRVTSTCCPATRAVAPRDCDPVTPIPTLFCPSPCR